MNAPLFLSTLKKPNVQMPYTGRWLDRFHEIIKIDPKNPKISNVEIAEKLKISERDLFRKVKRITGMPPKKYMRLYRLKQTMQMMKDGKFRTVKEASHAAGYSNVSYFIQRFEKEYGKKPFEVLKEEGWR